MGDINKAVANTLLPAKNSRTSLVMLPPNQDNRRFDEGGAKFYLIFFIQTLTICMCYVNYIEVQVYFYLVISLEAFLHHYVVQF
jgi:hypothetical protein